MNQLNLIKRAQALCEATDLCVFGRGVASAEERHTLDEDTAAVLSWTLITEIKAY